MCSRLAVPSESLSAIRLFPMVVALMPVLRSKSTRLRDLLHYPYGCVEQTTSSVFPLLYFGDLAKEWDPEAFAASDPEALVRAGIRRLGSMQLDTGGFAMWPGGNDLSPWGSVYATHLLVEARRAGHDVEAWMYDRALRFTAGEARAKESYSFDELQRTAYALYVLARAGKPDVGTMDFLREKKLGELKGEILALVAGAYASSGNARVSEELIARLQEEAAMPRQTGGNLNSPLRNRALLLLALMDAAPADPGVAETVQRLSREAEARPWWSTQETSFVFLALGQFHRRQISRATYTGTVFLGDRSLGKFTGASARFVDIEGSEPIRVAMDPGYQAAAAFYALRTRGVPTDDAFRAEQSGLELRRAFLDRAGRPLDISSVTQGDLIVIRTQARSISGSVDNVVVQTLLPSGLEVENPRLRSAETLAWINDADLDAEFLDLRDDRILLFTGLAGDQWRTTYALVRAVTPGSFRLPPAQVEAMYDASLRATTDRATMEVKLRP